jgi:ribonuclease BN (tRNA processing enzyme)
MAQEQLPWHDLDAIWISHFHMDHCGGLGPFFAGTKHAEKMKSRQKTLTVYGPQGLKQLISRFESVHNYRLLDQPFPVEIVEIETLENFEIVKDVEALAMSTPHTSESHALFIRDQEQKSFVYSADTGFDRSISTLANLADLLMLECTYFQNKPLKKHLELAEAMHLIKRAKPRKAVLTHFYPEWDDIDFNAEVAKFSPSCEVIQAMDGLIVEI